MERIFISKSHVHNREAVALKQWLEQARVDLANEIFLDLDSESGLQVGQDWKSQLVDKELASETVVCLLSEAWQASGECVAEFRNAQAWGKQIIVARLEDVSDANPTSEMQRCDLFADGEQTLIEVPARPPVIPAGPPVRFNTAALTQIRRVIPGTGIRPESFSWPPITDKKRMPYRGWGEPFEEIDAGVFFGRDAAIAGGVERLLAMRSPPPEQLSGPQSLFVILSPSGSGKSSFLRAGLIPRLRHDAHNFVVLGVMRPERNPLTGDRGLAAAIDAARQALHIRGQALGDIQADIEDASQRNDGERLYELFCELLMQVRAAAARPRSDSSPNGSATVGPAAENGQQGDSAPTLVLPLDQAEELFPADDPGSEAAQFLALIARLVGMFNATEIGLIVAATIRTDRYENMQNHPALRDIATATVELRPMPPTQFREVITGPAARAGTAGNRLSIAPDLVDLLVEDAAEGGDTLPLLSLTLQRLYKGYARAGQFTLADYEKLGRIAKVVNYEISQILPRNRDERQTALTRLRSAFIPNLVEITDTGRFVRRRAHESDLPADSRPLIDALVDRRLLVRDRERDGQVVVEVALESLFVHWVDLKQWLTGQTEDLKTVADIERSSAAWKTHDRHPDWLVLKGARLVDAETVSSTSQFSSRLADAREFMTACRQAEDLRLAEEEEQRQEALRYLEERARHAQESQQAAEALAAAESLAREEAQEHAAELQQHKEVLKRRNVILRIVAAVAVVAAVAALILFYSAQHAKQVAQQNAQDATAEKLVTEAEAILANTHKGDDVQAFQELLAADELATKHSEQPLVDALVKRSSTDLILKGSAPVVGAAFADNGHRLVVADSLKLRVWDTNSPTWLANLRAPAADQSGKNDPERLGCQRNCRLLPVKSHPTSVAISADGRTVTAGSEDGTVQVWNLDDQQATPKLVAKHRGRVTSVALSRDAHRLASAGSDGIIDLSNPDGADLRPINTGGEVFTVAFSPAADRLAAGGSDGAIRLWSIDRVPPAGADVPADATLLNAHTNGVLSVAFSPKGDLIASGGADNAVRLWKTNPLIPLEPLTTLTGPAHTAGVTSVAFNADGTRLVSGSNDKTVQLWDIALRQRIGDPMAGHQGLVLSVAFVPDGNEIVSCGNEHALRFWNATVGQPISAPLTGHHGQVNSVAISTDGREIASAGVDGTVRIWSADTGKQLKIWPQPGTPPPAAAMTRVAFNRAGDTVVSGSADGTIRMWQWQNDAVKTFDAGRPVTAIALSPNADLLAAAGTDGQITLWDLRSGQKTPFPIKDRGPVFDVTFDPQGQHLASGGIDGILRLWDRTGQQSWEADATAALTPEFRESQLVADRHPCAVLSVAFSPDGAQLASGSANWTMPAAGGVGAIGAIQLWAADAGKPQGAPIAIGNAVMSLAFSPKSTAKTGARVVGASFDPYTVELWNAGTGAQFTFAGHQAQVTSVAISPDGGRIISGSTDGTVRIWPAPPTNFVATSLCAKLTTNIGAKHWSDWISPQIPYRSTCSELPPTPDAWS